MLSRHANASVCPSTILHIGIGIVLSILFGRVLPHPKQRIDLTLRDPSYKPRESRLCSPPPILDHTYPVTRSCIRLISKSTTTLTFELTFPRSREALNERSITAHLAPRSSRQFVAEGTFSTSSRKAIYNVSGLCMGCDYIVNVYENFKTNPTIMHICTRQVSTLPSEGNLVQNPSFEEAAEAPFAASQQLGDRMNMRQWTPFYNGGARRMCSFIQLSNGRFAYPRSGNCFLLLGRLKSDWHWARTRQYFGAHHAVSLQNVSSVSVSAWYLYDIGQKHTSEGSGKSTASVVVSWVLSNGQLFDGVTLRLKSSSKWTPICIDVAAPAGLGLRMVHIYVHNDEDMDSEGVVTAEGGSNVILFDDVAVREVEDGSGGRRYCHHNDIAHMQASSSTRKNYERPAVHLRSLKRGPENVLTIAVPLTADRVLRLEMLSKQFGGGSIAAAVAVSDERELEVFTHAWVKKAWLREHVDVSFARRSGSKPLEINALRNMAIMIANTTFVAMLDVDMTPAPLVFDCLRDTDGTLLSGLLPADRQRVMVTSVFMMDTQQRAANNKEELQNAMVQRAGSAYCINSQKASRLKTWLRNDVTRITRFRRDYEPYAIGRRATYPKYDERFSGYGFNKISWLLGAEAQGWEIGVIGNVFVTHLNHVENSWVSGINETHYIQTWRRYLGLVSELGIME